MSIFRNDTVGSWTRGGQAIVHNLRMTTQVFYQTVLAGLVLWVMGIAWYALEKSTAYERFVLAKLAEALIKVDAAGGTNDPVAFRTPDGSAYHTSADWLLVSPLAKHTLHNFEIYLIHGALLSGLFVLAALGYAWFYFTSTGKGLGSNEYLRGARFGTIKELKRALWREKKGPITIGGVPMPAAYEPEHLLLCGAPGSGKTNIIVKMLAGIRADGKRAIVYDTAGTFVEKFYRPGIDTLLNPLDERTAHWSPWVDVPRDYHYDQIAESTIPEPHGDPFWAKASRGTLVAVMRKLARQKHTFISVLLFRLLRSKLKDLAAFVTGTEAAAFISTEGERTSAGIQAELASVMRSFSWLDDTEDGFSIRDWVEKGNDGTWLFITVKADQLPSLRPLITVWLDIAISAIMSLKPDIHRRLYCVIDELTTLQKLPSLSDFLARARKYGGCGILGFQSFPQLVSTYTKPEAMAITGYCSTWVALRANDGDTADHISANLGQVEQIEANEGMSYGVNDMRDGINLSRMQVTRPLVISTQVQDLPNFSGYLRFGRRLPVVQFTDSYNQVADIAPGFIERKEAPKPHPKAEELIRLAQAESTLREATEREAQEARQKATQRQTNPPALSQTPAQIEPSAPPAPAPKPNLPPAKRRKGRTGEGGPSGQNDLFPSSDPAAPPVPAEAPNGPDEIPFSVDDYIDAPPEEQSLPSRKAWNIVMARQGDITAKLVQHGEADGPREESKPA